MLKRKVELKSAVVYLKMQTQARREDIKNYLESGPFSNSVIERRVKKYLGGRGIYNNQNQLTVEGQKIRETGFIKESEEGKYQIWYTQNDPLFGNRIFYFRRIKPDTRGNPRLDPLELKFDNVNFVSLPIWGKDGKEAVIFSIPDSAGAYRGENKTGADIECTWVWDNMQRSLFTFSGKLKWSDIDEKQKTDSVKTDNIDGTKEIDLEIDFKPYIPKIIPNWDYQTKRCRLKLENINTDDVYQYFEYSGPRLCDGFDSCRFDRLPVEPYNSEEAAVWRNRLLNMELEKNYTHPNDFTGKVSEINEKDGFEAYVDQLDIPDIRRYINDELEPGKKSDRGASYWHLATPLDLNPGIPQLLQINSFSLKEGNSISFREIADKFLGGFPAEKVFYYDKHVAKNYQQRSAAAFLKSFDVSDMCVITDTANQEFNSYLSRNETKILVVDIGVIYPNRRHAPHDRYLILKKGNDLWVWTGTNSIDYIRFDRNIHDIHPDTPGNVLKSVTFTQVPDDVLGRKLIEFIQKEINNDANKA